MNEFNNFPYANTERLNLDWLIKKVQELEERVAALENANTETNETQGE